MCDIIKSSMSKLHEFHYIFRFFLWDVDLTKDMAQHFITMSYKPILILYKHTSKQNAFEWILCLHYSPHNLLIVFIDYFLKACPPESTCIRLTLDSELSSELQKFSATYVWK